METLGYTCSPCTPAFYTTGWLPSSLDFGGSHEQDVASKYLYEQNCQFILTNIHENIFLQQGRGALVRLASRTKLQVLPNCTMKQ